MPWYPLTWRGKALPLEPLLMVLLTFVGINAELWAGHKSYMYLNILLHTTSTVAAPWQQARCGPAGHWQL